MTDRRPITADDLTRIRVVNDPQLSPDGSRVACTIRLPDAEKYKYWQHLWIIATDANREPNPTQFTSGETSDAAPRWSPDGRQIAFLRTRDEVTQLWVISANGGEARQVTRLGEGYLGEPRWSPDGRRLAFTFRPRLTEFTRTARKEREGTGRSTPPRRITRLTYREDGYGWLDCRQHVWTCEVATGTATQLTGGNEDDFNLDWSPDGLRVVFASNRSADPESTPYLVDLWTVPATEPAEPVTTFTRIETPPGYKGNPRWSPDGRSIAYVGVESTSEPWVPLHRQVWVVSLVGGVVRCLTASLDRAVGGSTLSDVHAGEPAVARWSDDGSTLYFLVSDTGNAAVFRVGLDDGAPRPLTRGRQVVTGFSVAGERVVATISTPTEPGDVFLTSVEGGDPRRLTHLHTGLLDEVDLVEPEEIWVESGDGSRVQAWVLRPPGFDVNLRYPAILSIHGGPHAQYGNVLFHELQWHAARGYIVLYSNPRGSSNLTERSMAAIAGDWGNRDYFDLMAVADHAAGLPYVDAARFGVCGGSYGGYSTNWIVGHTDRFACAVADRTCVDLVSMWGQADFTWRVDGYWPGNPWKDVARLWERSPLTYAANCRTPTLLIHSEGDWRCPIGQAQEMYTALKLLKTCDVELVWYPSDTSHGMSRSGPIDLRLDRLHRYADWFDRYLRA